MFVNKLFTYLTCPVKSKRCCNVKSSTQYFHTKTKTLVDFQICISVPLSLGITKAHTYLNKPMAESTTVRLETVKIKF